MFYRWYLVASISLIGFALSGCETKSVDPAPLLGNAEAENYSGDSADCAIRRIAFDRTFERKNSKVPSILSGCEGEYRTYVVSETLRKKFTDLNQVPPPTSVLRKGIASEKLFQQLKLRGVAHDIAMELVDTPEFRRAAKAIDVNGII